MHYRISKFGSELNGTFIRCLNKDNHPVSVPYSLKKVKGGLNAFELSNQLINGISEMSNSNPTAFITVSSKLADLKPDKIWPMPPKYFKLGKLKTLDVENQTIEIEASPNLPIGNCGDGVAVNTKAARIMCSLYGILSHAFRCASHSSDGTLKRMTRSKTMCVDEMVELYESMSPVVKHFSYSVKNRETLARAMELLEMTPLHLLSWCGTRMAHFLDASLQINKVGFHLTICYWILLKVSVSPKIKILLF